MALTAKRFLIALVMLATPCDLTSAQDAYPTRPIRLVVGFAAGGSTDIPARYIADKLGALLGQRVIVENKAAAGGMLATRDVLGQPRDGYNLLLCTHFEFINTVVYRNAQYELARSRADLAGREVLLWRCPLPRGARRGPRGVRALCQGPSRRNQLRDDRSRIGAGDFGPAARALDRHHHEPGSLSRRRPGAAGPAARARAVLCRADDLGHPAGERGSDRHSRGVQPGPPRCRAARADAAGTGYRFRPLRLARALCRGGDAAAHHRPAQSPDRGDRGLAGLPGGHRTCRLDSRCRRHRTSCGRSSRRPASTSRRRSWSSACSRSSRLASFRRSKKGPGECRSPGVAGVERCDGDQRPYQPSPPNRQFTPTRATAPSTLKALPSTKLLM